MHEHKSRTQTRVLIHMNPRKEVFFNIFKHISTKTHPKHLHTPLKVSDFHLKLSHSKTQAFKSPKKRLKWKIKGKLENEKKKNEKLTNLFRAFAER